MERVIWLNRSFRQDMIIKDGLCLGMKISNAKTFSCSLQSLDFFTKYLSQIISDIVVPISYPNLSWTRRQDLRPQDLGTSLRSYMIPTHLWSGEAWVALWSSNSKRSLGIYKATSQRFWWQGNKDELKVYYMFQDRCTVYYLIQRRNCL